MTKNLYIENRYTLSDENYSELLSTTLNNHIVSNYNKSIVTISANSDYSLSNIKGIKMASNNNFDIIINNTNNILSLNTLSLYSTIFQDISIINNLDIDITIELITWS